MRRFFHGFFLTVGCLSIAIGVLGTVARCGSGPIGPIPGGALRGVFVSEIDEQRVATLPRVALQVNSTAPHSVTTWVLVVDGRIYVPAGFAKEKVWPQVALADPRVVLRVDHDLVERRAVRVTDPDELKRVRAAIAEKYDAGGGDEDDGTWFFRLDPPDD